MQNSRTIKIVVDDTFTQECPSNLLDILCEPSIQTFIRTLLDIFLNVWDIDSVYDILFETYGNDALLETRSVLGKPSWPDDHELLAFLFELYLKFHITYYNALGQLRELYPGESVHVHDVIICNHGFSNYLVFEFIIEKGLSDEIYTPGNAPMNHELGIKHRRNSHKLYSPTIPMMHYDF